MICNVSIVQKQVQRVRQGANEWRRVKPAIVWKVVNDWRADVAKCRRERDLGHSVVRRGPRGQGTISKLKEGRSGGARPRPAVWAWRVGVGCWGRGGEPRNLPQRPGVLAANL